MNRFIFSVIFIIVLVGVAIISYLIGAESDKGNDVEKIPLFIDGELSSIHVERIENKHYIHIQNFVEYINAETDKIDGHTDEGIYLQIKDPRAREQGAFYEVGSFKISDMITEKQDYGWSIAAEITNQSTEPYETVKIIAVYENRSGQRMGTASGIVYDLLPGSTKTLQFITIDDLSDYHKIRFQTDFIY